MILDGTFGSLAISPDGTKLALTCGTIYAGGNLILIDTAGIIIDSISSDTSIIDVEFNKTGNMLYYFVREKGFFRINLSTQIEDKVLALNWGSLLGGFDIYDDSLLFFGKLYNLFTNELKEYEAELFGYNPQFAPFEPSKIVTGSGRQGNIYITDLSAMTKKVSTQNHIGHPLFGFLIGHLMVKN